MSLRPLQRHLFDLLNTVGEPLARSRWSGPPPVGGGLTVLEATGRRSGALRARPVLTFRLGDVMVLGTVRRSSDWVANVRAHPDVAVWVDGRREPGVADVIGLPVGSLAAVRVR